MKTFTFVTVAVAILLVTAGIGVRFAPAEGAHTESPVLSFEDQKSLEQGSSPCPYQTGFYQESAPVLSFADQDAVREISVSAYVENRPVLGFDDEVAIHQTAISEEVKIACAFYRR